MPADNDPTNPRDDDGGGGQSNGAIITFGLFVVIVIIIAVTGVIQDAVNPDPTTGSCTNSCYLFLRRECPGERVIGGCFGLWFCSGPPHACGTNPP